jgi:serine/threonine protein kinase
MGSALLFLCAAGDEKSQQTAILEAAISSSLVHPNVVITYSHDLKPLKLHNMPNNDDGGLKIMNMMPQITEWKLFIIQVRSIRVLVSFSCQLHCMSLHLSQAHAQERHCAPLSPGCVLVRLICIDEGCSVDIRGHLHLRSCLQEYCDAGSLRQAVLKRKFYDDTRKQPRVDLILEAAKQLASGLAHIHSKGIIHGDLNPNNVS